MARDESTGIKQVINLEASSAQIFYCALHVTHS